MNQYFALLWQPLHVLHYCEHQNAKSKTALMYTLEKVLTGKKRHAIVCWVFFGEGGRLLSTVIIARFLKNTYV